jgi:hypothetical protein
MKNNFILNLLYHRKVTFFRMFMAKIGTFKNIIVPYKLGKEEIIPLSFILSTMEGNVL